MSAVEIVLLVLGILSLQAFILIPVVFWLRRKSARLIRELREDLAANGEPATRGPETALYRGATDRYPMVKGNGIIALTDRRLIFQLLLGSRIELSLDQLTGVREDKWFLRAYTGRTHLILRMKDGAEVGFMVADHPAWMAALRTIATSSST